MVELAYIVMALSYIYIGYIVAQRVFGPEWNEAPGSPLVCGAIWPLLVGTTIVQALWKAIAKGGRT